MKKTFLSFLMAIIASCIFGQEDTLQYKLDSIVEEGNLLYSYEKAVWVSTDLLMADEELKSNYGSYVVYHSKDSVFATYFNKSLTEKIAKYSFANTDLSKPCKTEIGKSDINSLEQELMDMKVKIVEQLSNSKYEITIPHGYTPNLVLIKEQLGYKLYILMGTTESGVIPFGNDYLFRADLNGEITSWKKFHSTMIPARSKMPNGEKVISAIHSHLKTTPYITSTDICTFRLYAKYCDMVEFSVYCTATKKYYKYNLNTNNIEITEP